jgi:hypothetical protein
MLLKLRYDGPLSNFAFNFILRCYTLPADALEPDGIPGGMDEQRGGGGSRQGVIENKHFTNVESMNRVRVSSQAFTL